MARNFVVFMDRGIIVLNKPAGLVAQGGRHAFEPEAATLGYVLNDLTSSLSLKETPRPVHRLDKLTTGALILARNPRTAQTLSTQLRRSTSNEITKTYLALAYGSFKPKDTGEVRRNLYIIDGKVSVEKPPEEINYREAASHTTWQCLASGAGISLMELGLRTGVKHQLRVTMAQILKAPILGDPLYQFAPLKNESYVMLHSARIDIIRFLRKPVFGSRSYRLGITVPPPAHFLSMCQNLGLSIAQEWTQPPVRVTINGLEIPYDCSSPLDEETVVDTLKKQHVGR